MPTREEMIAAIRAGQAPSSNPPAATPSRDDMIAAIRARSAAPTSSPAAATPTPPPAETNGPGAAEAALQGFGQGGTLGYLPQIQAGAGALMGQAGEAMGGPEAESYEDLKKYFQKRNENLKTAQPLASTAGNIAGAVMTLPVGGAEAEGASLGAKMLRAGGTGGAYGFAANPEVESTDQNPHAELLQRLKNMGLGLGLGAGGEVLVGGAGQAIANAGERMGSKAVVKQIGANAGQIKKILQKDEVPKIGSFLTDEGLMTPGKTIEDVADHTSKIMDQDGPKIGQLYEDAQNQSQVANLASTDRIDGPTLADNILDKVKSSVKNHPDRDLVNKTMESAVAPLRDMGDNANIVDLHQFRKGLDENINWGAKSQERDAVQRAYIDARNMVSDETKNVIQKLDDSLGGNKLDELKKLNDRYSTASMVNNIATQGAARETAKALMGQGILGAGAGGLAGTLEYEHTHDPLKALAVGLATMTGVTAARKFGAPVGYYGGKAAQAVGEGAAAITPPASSVGAGMISPWLNMRKDQLNGR